MLGESVLGGTCRSTASLMSSSPLNAAPRCSPRAAAFVASPVCLRIVLLITALVGGQYFLQAPKREWKCQF